MAWAILFIAGLLEIGWAIGLKYSNGFSRPGATIATVSAMCASMLLLGVSVRTLPLGTAYAVWTGIGAAGTVLLGMWLFGEPATFGRFFCLMLIGLGIAGLKVITPH